MLSVDQYIARWVPVVRLALDEAGLVCPTPLEGEGQEAGRDPHRVMVMEGRREAGALVLVTVEGWFPVAGDQAAPGVRMQAPHLQHRKHLTITTLHDALHDTLAERGKVLQFLKEGRKPPFWFGSVSWTVPRRK
jgi:hypothetical protein